MLKENIIDFTVHVRKLSFKKVIKLYWPGKCA